MVLEVGHLEGCQFPMAIDIHRYFRNVGNRSHSAGFSIRKVNLSWVCRFDLVDPVFVAYFLVNEVLCCS